MNPYGQPPAGYYRRGMTACELNAAAKARRVEKEREWDRTNRQYDRLFRETRFLTAMRFGDPRAKPILNAYRAKAEAIFGKSQTAAKPRQDSPPKSKTPRLDAYRAKFAKLENGLIRDGFLERIPEYDERGKLIGHRIKRAGDVKNFGRWVPTPEHDRRTRMRSLELEIERRDERERGGKIGVDVRWSPHAP